MFVSHLHEDPNQIIESIVNQIASEKNKTPHKIFRLLLVQYNKAIIRRFWEILNEKLPEHQYESLEYCRDCNEIYLGKAHTIDICLSAVEI